MDPKPTRQALLYALLDLTFDVAAENRALIADVLAKLDLTPKQAHVLWQIDPDAPAPAMRVLAAALHCDPSTLTFLADRLEKRALLTRQVDPTNRRVKTLVLTPAGRKVRQRLVHTMTTRSAFGRLTDDEQQQLYALLAKAHGPHQPVHGRGRRTDSPADVALHP